MFFNNTTPVLESANKEMEHVFIVQVDNYDEIKSLSQSVSHLEQWELKSEKTRRENAGTVRIRNIDNKKYMMGVKVYGEDKMDTEEHEVPVTRDMFEAFKKIAPMGTKKKRHSIKDPSGLVWEVDVYTDGDGREITWCKVDLEVKSRNTPVPAFPFAVKTVIAGKRTKDEEFFVKSLFHSKFNIYNQVNMLPVESIINS